MTLEEKKWEEEGRKIFVGPENSIYLGSFINGYVAACQKRQKITLNKSELGPIRLRSVAGKSYGEDFMTPILKLWLKKDPWHITTDEGDQNLILFMEDDDGKVRNFIIPMKDILDWDLCYEST